MREIERRDKKFLARDSTPDIRIVRSQDGFLYDAKGKKYIDFESGWCVGNFGWRNKQVIQAIKNFKGPYYVFPSYIYAP